MCSSDLVRSTWGKDVWGALQSHSLLQSGDQAVLSMDGVRLVLLPRFRLGGDLGRLGLLKPLERLDQDQILNCNWESDG